MRIRKIRLSIYIALPIVISAIIVSTLDTKAVFGFSFEIPDEIAELRFPGECDPRGSASCDEPTDGTDGGTVTIPIDTTPEEPEPEPCAWWDIFCNPEPEPTPEDPSLETVEEDDPMTIGESEMMDTPTDPADNKLVRCEFSATTFVLEGGEFLETTTVEKTFAKTFTATLTGTLRADTGEVLSGFDVQPEFMCDWISTTKLVVKPTKIQVDVFGANLNDGELTRTTIVIKEVGELVLNDNILTKYPKIRIVTSEIVGALQEGETSRLEFHVSGNFELYFQGFNEPSNIIKFTVPEDRVINFYPLTVDITKKEIKCLEGQIIVDGKCTLPTKGGETPPGDPGDVNPDPPDGEKGFFELYSEMINCFTKSNPGECLDNDKFTFQIFASIIAVPAIILINRAVRTNVATE